MTDKDIIELKAEERENGEIIYETTGARVSPKETAIDGAFRKVLGIAFTLAGLALAMIFFFYIVLPIIAVIIVYILLRNIYRSLVR